MEWIVWMVIVLGIALIAHEEVDRHRERKKKQKEDRESLLEESW